MPEESEAKHGIIRLRIHDVTQLFNSFDPDPFLERDLDDDAVDYIRSWVREIPRTRPLKLVVDITNPKLEQDHQALVQGAVHNYFGHLAELARNEFRQLMKRGRGSLAIGMTVLVIAVILSRWLATYEDWAFSRVLQETVLIGGWVAMWRPMEIFLYDWWPLRRQRKDYERLRDMPVEVTLPTPKA
ncbi:MAG: hypothetical protein H6839_16405 [Planctomycetes bacterium]|nr:hypothetical protein [Planctomycetota bacterium]